MEHHRRAKARLRFGPFEFDGRTLELRRGTDHVHLPPKPSRALDLLVRSAGSLVTRQQLHDHVWPDTFVELDQGLNTCMRHLRAVLGDDAEAPTYIETVPRRGYRFIAPVESVGEPAVRGPRRRRWAALFAGVAVLVLGAAWLWRGYAGAQGPTRVAVLPFEMIGGTEDDSLFVEGITEELLTTLATADPALLQVIARTSAYRIAQGFSLRDMRDKLGIDLVIQGRVRREPVGYKVTTQLVDTRTSTARWSGEYRRATATPSIPAQEHLSGQVAGALEGVLGVALRVVPHVEPPSRVAMSWQVARHLAGGGGDAAREQAVTLLGDVLAADQAFAPAHVALARTLLDLGRSHEAEGAIASAIDLLGRSPEILLERGRLRLRQWRLQQAGQDLAAAVAGAPQNARAHQTYGYYLSVTGQHREALAMMSVAEEIDPVSASVLGDAGLFAYWAGRPREAIKQCNAVLNYVLPQSRLMVHRCLFHNYVAIEAWDDALAEAGTILTLAEVADEERAAVLDNESVEMGLRRYYEWAARPENLPSSQGGDTSYRRALAAAGAGDVDGALAALQMAFDEREPRLIEIRVEARLGAIKDHPRFEAIAQAVGLTPSTMLGPRS